METTHRKMRRETKEAKAIQPTGTKTIQSKNGASYIAKIKEAIESNSPWEQEMKEMILAYERNTRKVQSLLLELFEILDSSGKLGQGIALYKGLLLPFRNILSFSFRFLIFIVIRNESEKDNQLRNGSKVNGRIKGQ